MPILGTEAGKVVFPQVSGRGPSVSIEGLGPVRALASYDESATIVGGQGAGLYSIGKSLRADHLLSTTPGIKFIAVNSSSLAYATDSAITIARIGKGLRLSEEGKLPLALMFSLISAIAFARVIIIDVIEWRESKRATKVTRRS
jgi:hypothetical protein